MIRVYIVFLLGVLCQYTYSQTPDWQWGRSAVSAADEQAFDIVTDPSTGDTYICGLYMGDLSGDFTLGLNGTPDFSSPFGEEGFVAKYDANGVFQWAFKINGSGNQSVQAIDLDATGSIYITGYFENTASFAGVTTSAFIAKTASIGTQDIFVAKYDSNGNVIWVAQGSNPGYSMAYDLSVNDDGVFICGWYTNSLMTVTDAVGTIDNTTLLNNSDEEDIFVAAFNLDGTQRWLRNGYGVSNKQEFAYGISTNATHVYVVGTFEFNTTFYDPVLPDLALTPYANNSNSIVLLSYNENTGGLLWADRIGTTGGDDCEAHGIYASGNKLYLTGGIDDDGSGSVEFPGLSVSLASSSNQEIFIAQIDTTSKLTNWVNYEINNSAINARGEDIIVDGSGVIVVTGYCTGSTVFNAGTVVSSGAQDHFVAAYNSSGNGLWVNAAQSPGKEQGTGISYDNMGAYYTSGFFGGLLTIPPQADLSPGGLEDVFVGKLLECSGPSITTCQTDTAVTADPTCNYLLADFTSFFTIIDDCGSGLILTQNPVAGTVLAVGQHDIELIATDAGGNADTCLFSLTVEADVNPTVVSCGDLLTGQSTFGSGNTQDTWSCDPALTPGEDVYYQITVPTGNYLLGTTITNASDANDDDINVYWIGGVCPLTSMCLFSDEFDISDGDFDSNNQSVLLFNAVGPGTYFFVVDSETDGIDSYDIEFTCLVSGVEFDPDACGLDTDGNGVYTTVNGTTNLSVEPCQSVSVCNTLYIQNINAGEWMDTVQMSLGPCFTGITNTIPDAPGPNGVFDVNGTWNATYDPPSNSIEWGFDYSGGQLWGDGPGSMYNCAEYTFCFDAVISLSCMDKDSLLINIFITDDAVDGLIPGSSQGFDYAYADSLDLIMPDPGWDIGTLALCNNDPNYLPLSVDVPGGVFSASPVGLIFADNLTGEINLSASTPGAYTITYAAGFCTTDSTLSFTINAEDDPYFDYPQIAYCQGDIDPVATNTATPGGTFTAPAQIVFLNTITGEIDLSASTVGGPYTITYTSPGPDCPNVATFDITINAEDDPYFDYPQITYCQGDIDPVATNTATPGGTFSAPAQIVFLNTTTGEIDLSASTVGGPYTITYTSPGPDCPNLATFDITINAEDDPYFDYPQIAYCQGDIDPVATNTATPGGTFSAPAQIVFLNTTTGEIDLSASTVGGPYTITYTSPGPSCPNVATFDITINAEDDPNFNYSQTEYCQGDPFPVANIIGTSGGTFSSTGPILFVDIGTGEISLAASAAGGPYTITYTTPGPSCPNTATFDITINAEDDPSFGYSSGVFCQGDGNQLPVVSGTSGGTFSADAALDLLSSSTGEIDLLASSTGSLFWVTYTTPGPDCPNDSTLYLIIHPEDTASFDYLFTEYCQSDQNPVPVIHSTTGGIFTSDGSLQLVDTLTGEIDLLNSATGQAFEVYYHTTGNCPDTTSRFIEVYEPPQADAGPDQELFFDFNADLNAAPPSVGQGEWSFSGNYYMDELDPMTAVENLNVGVNYFQWSVSNGPCPDAGDEVLIFVNDIWIPQAITPNGDGDNEVWFIPGIENTEHDIKVFNRWGQLIFESTDYSNDWAGTDQQGNELEDDTYFYIIVIGDNRKFDGYIVIKR